MLFLLYVGCYCTQIEKTLIERVNCLAILKVACYQKTQVLTEDDKASQGYMMRLVWPIPLYSSHVLCIFPSDKIWVNNFEKNSRSLKARVTWYDLSDRLFCIQATSLCKFPSDKIWVNNFEKNRRRLIARITLRTVWPILLYSSQAIV